MFVLQYNFGVHKITHNQHFLPDGTHKCAIYQHFFDKKTFIKNKHYGGWVASDGIDFISEFVKSGSKVEMTHTHAHARAYCQILFAERKHYS
jgi:hypothetical protein